VGNYRRYSDADIQLLEHIKKLRDLLGFSLADIREIMEAEAERDELKVAYRHETDSAAKISQLDRSDELVRRQLNLIEQKMVGLEQMQMTFKATIERHEQIRKKLLDKSSL